MRSLAAEVAAGLDGSRVPNGHELESSGLGLLDRLGLPRRFLGYAMVAVNNAFWLSRFGSVPFERRLLLLPHCLSSSSACTAPCDASGLQCANCGGCDIGRLKEEAESLGYEVITAEGTSSATMKILHGDADAILGVACLDSLERSYTRIVDLGIPHIAVPLLRNGCVDTEVEADELIALLHAASDAPGPRPRTYLPLLRETVRIFDPQSLSGLLPEEIGRLLSTGELPDPMMATEAIALDWLANRGKRLRPFLTTSAYAVARYGSDVLSPDTDPASTVPAPVRRIAIAIEALHKASLIHDDIEDDDEFRYGRRTIHRRHGVGPAINVGDYLVGLGYSLIAGETASLGAQCVADILTHLSSAHLELCRGQGAELLWKGRTDVPLRPIDALSIYALKTAPALQVAIYSGLRAADAEVDPDLLHRFCVLLGEGYQVLNDLDDWRPDAANRVSAGGDALSDRPTVLHAFALQAAGAHVASLLPSGEAHGDAASEVDRLRGVYEELGAFEQARVLVDRLRERAERLAEEFEPARIRELMSFLVGLILPRRPVA